jgi:predicted Kef-type K+ transport protein
LAAGILVGPSGIGLISSHDQIALLAHIGIALLLFVVGLKLDCISSAPWEWWRWLPAWGR